MSCTKFEPITLDRREEYAARLAACPQVASDYSFANIWGWAEEYGLEWAWGEHCVWIRRTKPDVLHWAPVGPWDKVDWSANPHLHCIRQFTRVPEALAEIWKEALGDKVDPQETRGHWDYLYAVNDLVSLKGNKFHKKKNHLNQFKKKFDFVYSPMTMDCVEEVLEMQEEWVRWREVEDSAALLAENRAVRRVLTAWDRLPELRGGTLRVDGKIIAYTVGEPLSKETLVVHFEKARPDFRGAYQGINQQFLCHEGIAFTLVNREQDLGDEGLRKAKLSYHPADFLKKFSVRVE